MNFVKVTSTDAPRSVLSILEILVCSLQGRYDPVSRPVPSRPGTGRDGIFKGTRDFQKLKSDMQKPSPKFFTRTALKNMKY